MKWTKIAAALVATLGLTSAAEAGLLDLFKKKGSSKCCECAPTCQPRCCAPTITKPCCPKVHTYQRKVSTLKPPCCDTCCAPKACCPKRGKCCAPVARGCCPQKGNCAAPCGPVAKGCCPQPRGKCCAPVARGCCPQKGKCCAPVATGCCNKGNSCCNNGCGEQRCCNADPCEIAKLIYASQTGCRGKDRRKAIKKLGKFDCVCNPEIMVAFIYALNDADEKVREEAAEEIGDQLKDNPCCCNAKVTAALTAALGDCVKDVRKDAEKALRYCGYEVVDGCCEGVCCDPCKRNACGGCCAPQGGMMKPTPAPKKDMKKGAPPLPGAVYAPRRVRRVAPQKNRLSNLFGLLN